MTAARVYRRGQRYWLAYPRNGRIHRESARTTDPAAAHALLAARLLGGSNVSRETFDSPGRPAEGSSRLSGQGHLTCSRPIESLFSRLIEDYMQNRRRSLPALRGRLARLSAFFSIDLREPQIAASITGPHLAAYIAFRLNQGAAHATVNRELAALKRAFKLAGMLPPAFQMLREDNARQGFVSREVFDRIRAALPEHLRDPVAFLYFSSWRPSEMRSLLWSDVEGLCEGHGSQSDLANAPIRAVCVAAHSWGPTTPTSSACDTSSGLPSAARSGQLVAADFGTMHGAQGDPATGKAAALPSQEAATVETHRPGEIRLRPEHSKNGRARILPLAGELLAIIERAAGSRSADSRYVFSHNGRPLRDFRRAWATATRAAGVPGLLLYDLRRSAIRNFVRQGVPERVAMALSGHLTRSTFDRYNIVSTDDLRNAMEKTCR